MVNDILDKLSIIKTIDRKIEIIEKTILKKVEYYDSEFDSLDTIDYYSMIHNYESDKDYFEVNVLCDYDWYDMKHYSKYNVRIPFIWLEKSDEDLKENAQQYIEEIQTQVKCEE